MSGTGEGLTEDELRTEGQPGVPDYGEQWAHAAEGTGQAALGSYDFYVENYPNLDWTPEEAEF